MLLDQIWFAGQVLSFLTLLYGAYLAVRNQVDLGLQKKNNSQSPRETSDTSAGPLTGKEFPTNSSNEETTGVKVIARFGSVALKREAAREFFLGNAPDSGVKREAPTF